MTTNKIASGAPVPIVNTSTSAFVDAGNLTKVPGWKLKSTCGFPLRVLYFVHTAPAHFYRRRVLRDTIGDPTVAAFVNSTIAFFVGKTSNTDVSEEVRAEAECEGDLVLLDHVDTYRNLTLKFIGATKWLTANHCLSSSTNVVVKLDDDVLVNVFLLAYYVERHMNAAETRNWRTIHCATSLYLKPFRDKNSKWFVTKEEYANDTYPPFCYGAAYLMKASVLVLLGEATGSVPFFWVDDVYSTGLLRNVTNVSLVNITRMYHVIPPAETTAIAEKTLFLHWGQRRALLRRVYRLWVSVLITAKLNYVTMDSGNQWVTRDTMSDEEEVQDMGS
ncbi:beta-1,3-galactosyltransferase 5 [Rhipicephalus microplus]|uniref:beta-1,3-galactosyltransferase 5 n=1 Tax=Rhipicephalus microplus TaxID=6941 RepID=UPI003F6B1F09